MASSGSSRESNRPHRRRELGRTSRSRDTRHHTHIEEVDYDADENNPLPSINPPPGTEIARGVPDPPQPSDTVTGDHLHTHQTTTSPRAVSGPPFVRVPDPGAGHPGNPLSSRDHRTSRTTRSPLTRQFDLRRSSSQEPLCPLSPTT